MAAAVVALLAASAPAQPPADSKAASPVVVAGSRWRIKGDQGRIVAGDRGRVMLLTGNVSVVRDDLTITAQRARRDIEREETDLVGAVHAVSESLTVWADSVHVYEHDDRVHAFGKVKLKTLEGTTGSGDRGVLLRRSDWLALAGKARVMDAQLVIDADSITFDRRRSELQAYRDVQLVDEASRTVVTGEHARLDRAKGMAWVDSLPKLVTRKQGGPTAEVESQLMIFAREGNTRRAVGNVRFRQGVTQATADTADFVGEDLLILRGSPQVEQERQLMSGDEIRIWSQAGELRRVDVYGGARLRDSSPDSLRGVLVGIPLANELSGDTLRIDVANSAVTHTHVRGNARSTYLPEDQSASIAVNEVAGTQIDIGFEAGRVARVLVVGPVEGNYRYLERKGLAAALDSTAAGADSVLSRQGESAPADTTAAAAAPTRQAQQLVDFETRASGVQYKGETADFDVAHGTIHIKGKAEVRTGTLVLGSGDIRFDTRNEELMAEGDPLLSDKGSELLGERMGYLFEAKTGAVLNGVTQYDDGFYYGKHVRRIDDRTMLVRDGTYTSCDLAEPHYHFTAKRMKLSLRERVVARQVTFYVSDLPVLTFPFFFKSLDSGRHSGILFPRFNVGVSSREGRYIRDLGYYWATNDYTDFTVEMDYNERKDLTTSLRNRYKVRYGVDGNVNFTYRSAFGVKSNEQRGDEWRLEATHNHPNLWDVWNAGASINASSSSLTQNNLSSDARQDRLDTQLRSTARLARTFGSGQSLSLSATRSQFINNEDDDPVTNNELVRQTLPAVTLGFKTGPLLPALRVGQSGSIAGDALRATQFSQSYRGQAERRRSENGVEDRYSGGGSYSLSFAPRGLIGPFKFTSSSGFGFDWSRVDTRLDRYVNRAVTDTVPAADGSDSTIVVQVPELAEHVDSKQDEVTPRLTFSNSLRTDLYGIFRTGLGPLTGVKHKLSWSMGHSFQPALGDKQRRQQSFNFSLGNELSFKLRPARQPQAATDSATTGATGQSDAKEAPARKLERLLAWNVSSSFNPEAAARERWSTINSELGIQPIGGRFVNLTVSHRINPDDFRVESVTTSLIGTLDLRNALKLGGALLERKERRSPLLERLPARADSAGADSLGGREGVGGPRQDGGLDQDSSQPRGAAGRNELPWTLGLRYSHSQTDQRGNAGGDRMSTNIGANLQVALPGAWTANWSAQFDLQEGLVTNQYWSLRRDLHCWTLEFDRSVAGDGSEFGFKLYLKQIPDVKITRGNQGIGDIFSRLPGS